MAYAYTVYSAGSSQTDYTIPWPYIKEEHVKVYVNFVDTTFTFHNATTARLASAPATGTRVEVRRVTPPSAVLVDYADGSTLTASDLDTSNLQHLYIAQELDDAQKQGISIDAATGQPTLNSQRLTNVTDPSAAQDAATKNYVDTQDATKQPLDAELTELATMASTTASALADLTQSEVQILDGATVSTDELNFVDGVTSALQTQLDAKQALDADLTALAGCQSGAATNIALLTSGEVAILDGATVSTDELNTLSGLLSSTAELNKLDGVTSTTANLNVVSGMTKATSLTSNSDTELPTSKAVADHVTSVVNALGGFVAINGPTNFPATQPDQDVVVSIKDVGSGFTTSSNEITITNGAGTGKNVKITDFPSEYAAATLVDDTGLQVTSNKSASDFSSSPQVHRYKYHKQLAKESDVKALSDDINAFNERYRTATGSNPSTNNHAGDLFFSQDTDKMYVRNAANNAWDEVVSVGEFFINTLSSVGNTTDTPPGGSASFNGQARKFTLSNAPSVAQQLIVSINGVIQKPNSGDDFPSEGFSINGSTLQLAAAPATGAPFFIITIGSTVNIGTPSAGTVDLAKLSTSNTGSTGQYLKKDGSTQGIGWADVTVPGGANAVTFNNDIKANWGTDADLQVWHNDTDALIYNTKGHTSISNSGTGDIFIQAKHGEDSIKAIQDQGVELYHDDEKRFETTGEGIAIFGAAPATLKISDTGGSGYEGYIQMRGNDLEIRGSNGQMEFYTGAEDGASSTERLKISNTGVVTVSGNLIPEANNTRDLGSSSNAWANIYTNDLNLSNEGSNNDIDGSWGSFTIQEGEDDLFLINRRNGKKYKFNLTEVN